MMKREVGDRNFPLWLVGDSNPIQWQSNLKTPLDPRHPVRHNIWTSILDIIQDRVFRSGRNRVDTAMLYIRNAVDDPAKKPSQTSKEWSRVTEIEIDGLRSIITIHKPVIIFCFGAFAFEFTRRAHGEQNRPNFVYWGSSRLGNEFRRRLGEFDVNKSNIIPLLHRSISGGKFIKSHKNFCGQDNANYFEVVGNSIADTLIQYKDRLKIWIE